MRLLRKINKLVKPSLGFGLNGQSTLSQGLKLAAILNEDATTGPLLAGGGPGAKVYDIRGRPIGNGTGTLGPSAPSQNWQNSLQGRAFINRNTGSSGALDFGALSTFGTFTNITFAALCAPDTNHPTISRVFSASNVNGNGNSWALYQVQSSSAWHVFLTTSGGIQQDISGTMSRPTNALFMDLVVGTYDGVTFKLYINGRLATSSSPNSATSFTSTDHVYLSGWTGATAQNCNAPIGVAYLWNRVLTAAEIQLLYLDPYWAVIYDPKHWSGAFVLPPPPPPPSTPTAAVESPLNARGRTGKSGIKQALIAIPEMQNFDEVRQVMAKAINDLQIHIASQLPVLNHQGQRIQNVGPPVSADDVVTLRYLQSIYNPPGTSTKT